MMNSLRFFIMLVLLLILSTGLIYGGTTGKISGQVIDVENGEPLPGVNVIIVGTSLGAATDLNGNYFILNIPPGIYSVQATMIGYEKIIKKDVRAIVDRSIGLDFSMKIEIIAGTTVTVVAERPLIEKDITSKTTYLDFEKFQNMPVTDFTQAIAVQAGMTTGDGGELHLRGGRAGEIAYMIDGVLVQDPYFKSGASSFELDKYTIQEMQLITGAFSAEYGQAMSGIINIVTKDPDIHDYHGRIEYRSQNLVESPYQQADWMLHTDLFDVPEGEEAEYRDKWRLYSSEGETSHSQLPGDDVGVSEFKNYDFTEIPGVGKLPEIFGSPMHGYYVANLTGPVPFMKHLSFFVTGRYDNFRSRYSFGYDATREINGKFIYNLTDFKIKYNAHITRRYYKPYSHRWRYNPDGYEARQRFADRHLFEITHTISPRTFYTTRLYYEKHYHLDHNPNRKFKISDYPAAIYNNPDKLDSVIAVDSDWEKYLSTSDGWYYEGDRGRYEENITETFTLKFDLISQISLNHQLKFGFEGKKHDINRDRWRYIWPGSAHYVEIYDKHPKEFASYIQDKMEYQRFVMNVGLRFDYFDANATMFEDIFKPGTLDPETGEWIPAEEKMVDPQIHYSPRIGIAYPITDRMTFSSNYGHFYEIPRFYDMFKHHDATSVGDPLLGNPSIKSQKTVTYEFGLKYSFAPGWIFEVSAYFKDITNLASSTYKNFYPYDFTVYENSDYASTKGIELTIEKKYGQYVSGILNYTFSVARGNESASGDGYDLYRGEDVTMRPNREFYLDFDRRHDISMNVVLNTPDKFGPPIGNFYLLGDMNISIIGQLASGLPYTPYFDDELGSIFIEQNTGRKPWTKTVDLHAHKGFQIYKKLKIETFIMIRNLFNTVNTRYVWSRTGDHWNAGPKSSYSQDRQHDPSRILALRSISIGARFLF